MKLRVLNAAAPLGGVRIFDDLGNEIRDVVELRHLPAQLRHGDRVQLEIMGSVEIVGEVPHNNADRWRAERDAALTALRSIRRQSKAGGVDRLYAVHEYATTALRNITGRVS